ncbi:DUF4239 domain-containing protein [Streptomyces sp. NPDC052101]|uniref:bestrophin-like domain n=1 Tax=Streptomyces sp. NPDC052101 TaxID=3155763 RepID=UPI003424168F
MALWLLNHLSTPVLTLVVVGGVVLVSLAGNTLVRRRFPAATSGEHNDMVGVVLGVFGAIYGIILAFVIVTLWDQLEAAETTVAAEATDMALIVRDANAFPAPARARLDAVVHDYLHGVVDRQWPLMREGHAGYGVTQARIDNFFTAVQGYEPTTQSQQTFYGEVVTRLNDVAAQRRDRLDKAAEQLPLLLQILAYGGALVIIPLTYLYGIRQRVIQSFFVTSVAALIALCLLLVIVLDRPFSGDVSVSPQPYKQGALARFWEKSESPR